MAIPFILKNDMNGQPLTLTVFVAGKQRTITKGAPLFDAVFSALKDGDSKKLTSLFEVKKSLAEISNGRFKIYEDDTLMFDGKEVKNVLVGRMVGMLKLGLDVTPLCLFLENLMQNPSQDSINETYLFLEHNDLPITEDGHFLAYKVITSDYKDCYSQTMDYSVGSTPEMRREDVESNRDITCSRGLHFCSRDYIKSYGGSSGYRLVVMKINPRDVVSIPSDYNNAKGRCCKFHVLEEIQFEDHIVPNFVPDGQSVTAQPTDGEEMEKCDECLEFMEDCTCVGMCDECGEFIEDCTCDSDPVCETCEGLHDTEDHEDDEEETSDNGDSKAPLTDEQVRNIRKALANGNLSLTAIGNMFNRHRSQIQRIRDGLAYAHVK